MVVERGRPRVRREQDVVAIGGLAPMGQLPLSRGLRAGTTRAYGDPTLASAVRAVMARTERAGGPARADVLGITAPDVGHGATTLALAYASALARQGKRVIVVDTDLARRSLTEVIRGSRADDPAVSALLRGEGTLEDCLVQGPVSGVMVLPAALGPEGLDLLTNGLDGVLKLMLKISDRVILDCPPVDEDDGQSVLACLPAALVVLRSGAHTETLTECTRVLSGVGTEILGVVLNRSAGGSSRHARGRAERTP